MDLQGTSLEKQRYILQAQRKTDQNEASGKLVVKVRNFHISSKFSSKSLTYRTSEFNYNTDFYNEFLTSPASNITEETIKWLGQSGVFANVAETQSNAQSDLLLEGTVTDLYGDYRNKSRPRAVMNIWFAMLDNDRNIEFRKSYEAIIKLDSKTPEELIKGLSSCLEKILTNLESDLRKTF
jgi:ABC-type uncharacterized transport system auxiliary subunit